MEKRFAGVFNNYDLSKLEFDNFDVEDTTADMSAALKRF